MICYAQLAKDEATAAVEEWSKALSMSFVTDPVHQENTFAIDGP